MTPKERVIAALNLRVPDRIPWGEHSIDYNIYEMILGRESFLHAKFKETKAYWDGRRDEVVESYKRDSVDIVRALDMDLVTVSRVPPKDYRPVPLKPIDSDTYTDSEGAIYKISNVTGDLIKTPLNTAYFQLNITLDEVEDLIHDLTSQPAEADADESEYEVIGHVVKELGDTHFIIAPVNGIEWPRFGTIEEESWINLILEPEICKKIAEYQYLLTVRELGRLKALGVDGVLSVGDLGHTKGLAASPELYREIVYPYHSMLYTEYKKLGLYVLRHCCGHVWPIIHELCECNDAYEGIQESAGMDIVELKKAVGDKICLWGGIMHEHIHGGTARDIREDAIRSFRGAAKGGGFIMGSSHSLTINAQFENIMEMKRCRDELGVYPIR
jgi:uroporphyrinogen decarboxylase